MNIQAEKLEIMRMVLETKNPKILEAIKKLFIKEESEDFWKTLSLYEKDDILDGLSDLANEESVDYEELIKKHR